MTVQFPLNAPDLRALDKAHHLHPWANFGPFEAKGALVMARGEGCWLWDTEGRRYFDAIGGMWCTNIGLGRREMAEAIADQVQHLAFANSFVDMTNGPAALLAAKLASLAPGDLNRVHFTTGGSDAVDTAYRMVQYYQSVMGRPSKTQMIAREYSYHGSTYISQSIGKRPGDRVPFFRYKEDGIHHLTAPNAYRAPDGMGEAAFCDWLVAEFEAKLAEIGPENVGGFFAEPVQASGGVIVPPAGYLPRMAAICRQHDILFVADEVVTAFGRLGHWFASWEEFGVQPDIITCAKGLTSGYLPLGALIFTDRIWEAMAADGARWFTSGFTYSGHPVACAAALKNIEIIEREDLLGNATRIGTLFEARMKALEALPMVGQVRGRKLMVCVENVADKATKALLPEELDVGTRIADTCEAMGLLVRPMGHLNVMSPPLILTATDVDLIGDTLEAAIRQVADALVREGVRLG
ncbi:Adenosylmethionine-8-amino-7-oxononanoate aminotransferase [Gemmobacter aquatilis]|uniref:Adenosylmethionine-8-amino-7-oxononanoate aminotransferase n=1 Tax=Gemmobacter aquatilis TaxID=933059 RepID=A0A1H8B578_9RHOB|nr:aminotransferase [Gemmobacter aquatilis]SEM77449.1 Adenosylmethionine-8-amino-7-oxononanoate aminotransferase [Gemmobacter aquatilis]